MVFKVALLGDDSQHKTSSNIFRVAFAVTLGLCLVSVSVLAMSASNSTLVNTNASESISLFGIANKAGPVLPMTMRSLPGPSPWKELVLAAIEDRNHGCVRDVSMHANRAKEVFANLNGAEKALVVKAEAEVKVKAQDFLKAGQLAPTGFFDPAGFSANIDGGKLLFYREAELKHGRVCMLASLGIIVGEKFHTFFPDIDVPAAKLLDFNFKDGSLQNLWYGAFLVLGAHELVFDVLGGKGSTPKTALEFYKPEPGQLPGDLGFDPLNIKPKTPEKLLEMQNKELNNGRLAMLGWAGIIAQETVTGQKIF